jgi:hypothetical protein
LARLQRLPVPGDFTTWFIPPEDLILKKMDAYREGRSEKHLRDIASILKVSAERIDRGYITEWSNKLRLSDTWNAIVAKVNAPGSIG